MSVLAGALNAADVIDVADDADSLRSAAQRFSAAAEGVLSAATSGSITWSGLPAVFTSDALQPALAPLMGPALQKAKQIQTAADEFLQVASIAANRIEDLKHDHDVLVRQIEQFHASAPGRVAAEAAKQAARGDLLGAVGTVVENWQQVPALVTEEVGLRVRVQAHNDNVTSTMNAIAAQVDAISPSSVNAHPVHTAAQVSSTGAKADRDNWFEDAWNTTKAVVGVGGAVLGAEAEAMWPHVQDAAATAGNIFASLGNAMTNHPDEVLELLGGIAMMAGGSAMEVGGGALDLTGVGAIGGVPLNIAGAGVIAAGAGMAATGGGQLGIHAMTDDRNTPYRTDHASEAEKARRAKEPHDKHGGRSKDGKYRSQDNSKARVDAAEKEAQGIKQVEKRLGTEVDTTKVKARVDGVSNGRVYDGLAKKPDGTYVGIEIKSGAASRNAEQRAFDGAVSPSNPAIATLNGRIIKITEVIEQKVP
ncbi:hypothetical protein ACIQUC_15360 [Curtobacterium sp. NPDC098951]|uniref:hypothetical protein n=1 Tax=Curtobacterium sp. NPDC098951 TaxID=3363974 RepID=UPI00380549DB